MQTWKLQVWKCPHTHVHKVPKRPADLRPAGRADFCACLLHEIGLLICNPLTFRDFTRDSRDELTWTKYSTLYLKQEFTIRQCRIFQWPADLRPADRHKHVSWQSEQRITKSNLGMSTAYCRFIGNLDKKIPSVTADPTDPAGRWNLQRKSEVLGKAMRQELEAQVADMRGERMPARP